jgi:hypothetical protein
MTGSTRKDARTGERIVIYKCPPKGFGGCGRVSRTAAPIDEHITALVLMEQSKIQLRKLEEVPPWDGEAELKAVLAQIKETTEAYEGGDDLRWAVFFDAFAVRGEGKQITGGQTPV